MNMTQENFNQSQFNMKASSEMANSLKNRCNDSVAFPHRPFNDNCTDNWIHDSTYNSSKKKFCNNHNNYINDWATNQQVNSYVFSRMISYYLNQI